MTFASFGHSDLILTVTPYIIQHYKDFDVMRLLTIL